MWEIESVIRVQIQDEAVGVSLSRQCSWEKNHLFSSCYEDSLGSLVLVWQPTKEKDNSYLNQLYSA